MKHRILFLISLVSALLCALNAFAASQPQKGHAVILGVKSGKVQIFIREVNGAVVGDLPFKPSYREEVKAGMHRIQPFCIVKQSWGQEMGPAIVIEQEFAGGGVYQLEYVGKEKDYVVRVKEVAPKKK